MSTAKHEENPEGEGTFATLVTRFDLPIRRRARNLAHEIVEALRAQIHGRILKPGAKLPTESDIMRAFGVSRTVVREALSKLQAASLVETRHGVGTFVLESRQAHGFGIEPGEIATAGDIMAVLELRISLETESAGLAAQRRNDAQLAEMRAALDAFEANLEGAGDAVSPDFRFHLCIANATGNRYFADIMSHLGATVIPRTRIDSPRVAQEGREQYLRRVNREHEEIFQAIARRDSDSARAAMRIHLTNSRERLRKAQEEALAASLARVG